MREEGEKISEMGGCAELKKMRVFKLMCGSHESHVLYITHFFHLN